MAVQEYDGRSVPSVPDENRRLANLDPAGLEVLEHDAALPRGVSPAYPTDPSANSAHPSRNARQRARIVPAGQRWSDQGPGPGTKVVNQGFRFIPGFLGNATTPLGHTESRHTKSRHSPFMEREFS
ncbi:hypothetical protein GCM10017776_51680 [Streptomyces griseoluteus]|nr:hypothetical protein GCM10017776_51680 [Streptomyces griseoluteus]